MNLEEAKSNRVSCIYRITFPDGKYYVGRTKSLRERVRLYERKMSDETDNSRVMTALREFGIENVSWDILSCVSVRDADNLSLCLSILEIKYIREQDCIYPNGYNTSIGGELLGIPADVIETKFGVNATGYAGKPLLVYDKDGVFMNEYPSVAKCAYALGVPESHISNAVDKIALVRSTYMVREKKYGDVPQKILPFAPQVVKKTVVEKEVEVEKVFVKKELDKASIMYDEYGEYVGIFESTYQVRKYIGIDCRFPFGREYHGYYLFHYNGGEIKKSLGVFTSKMLTTTMYDDILALGDAENIGDMISLKVIEEEKEDVKQRGCRGKAARQVNKYALDGEYIETYDSISDAARANETFESSIRACCNRKTRRSGGFIYRFSDDKEPVVMEKPASVRVSKDGKVSYKKRYVIEQCSLDGTLLNIFNTIVEAGEKTGISQSAIWCCVNGKTKKSGGYMWRKVQNKDYSD